MQLNVDFLNGEQEIPFGFPVVAFIFQFKVFHFSAIFFLGQTEQSKTIAFYKILHHF